MMASIDFAQLTARSAASSELPEATKYPMTASPTNFSASPRYALMVLAISCAKVLIIMASFSSGRSRASWVEPTRSTYKTTDLNLLRTLLRRNFSEPSRALSYSYPSFSDLHMRVCVSRSRVSESSVVPRSVRIMSSTSGDILSVPGALSFMPCYSSGKSTPQHRHLPPVPSYRSSYSVSMKPPH